MVYEVKVNYDFYDYVDTHGYYKYNDVDGQEPLLSDAAAGRVTLPYRTSAAAGPRRQMASAGHEIVTGYSSADAAEHYVDPAPNALPPRIGAIHLKAAWIRLGEGPCHERDDGTTYHTADAAYYVSVPGPLPTIEERMGCFGLIGLHIIQRIHTEPRPGSPAARAPGGTFIFATWEHVDNDQAGFTYANYYDPDGDPHQDPKPPEGFYPAGTRNDPNYPVERRFPAISNPRDCPDPVGSPETCTNPGTREVNQIVHAAIRRANPDSLWLNYRLVGSQFTPIGVGSAPPQPPVYPVDENDPTGIGQQLYLANLVVETNDGLQKFQGLPPQTQPIERYVGVGVVPNPAVTFDRRTPNISYTRFPYNMGGCMGCHGVAQSKGYSFSFVLLGGFAGASTDTETNFDVPPPPVGGGTPVGAETDTGGLLEALSSRSTGAERRIP